MALKYIQGFDSNTIFNEKWTTLGTTTLSPSYARIPGVGQGLYHQSTGSPVYLNTSGMGLSAANGSTIIFGVANKLISTGTDQQWVCIKYNAATGANYHHILVFANTTSNTYTIASSDSTTWIGTTPSVGNIRDWHYIEFKITFHDTAGSVEVRLNGASTPFFSVTGVKTKQPGQNNIGAIWFGDRDNASLGYGYTFYLDDFYLCDDTGTTNNDFLGECRVETLVPTSDTSTNEFVPSTGTDHFALVDETTSSTADYLTSTIVGQKELFNVTDLSNTPAIIYGVQATAYMGKTNIGPKQAKILVNSNSTESASDAIDLNTSPIAYTMLLETNPDGNIAWDQTSIDAIQIGVESV